MPAFSPAEIHPLVQDAFNRGDAAALVALYEPEALLVVNGQIVTGHENLRHTFEAMLSLSGRMTLETLSVVESAQGLAVLHGRWTVRYPGEPKITSGISTEVVRRQPNGTWLFVIDNPYTPL